MKVVVDWQGDVCFQVELEIGYILVMDGLLDYGGKNCGVWFMEMVLMGVGGCFSFDVVYILCKVCQDVIGCCCEMEVEWVEDEVLVVFIKIYLYFWVSGNNFKENQVKCVVELFVEKYCFVVIMLICGGVVVMYSYSIEF